MSTKKSSRRKKADATIKKDISSAVDSLPELIAREASYGNKKITLPLTTDNEKRPLLWFGVGITILSVLTMWLWNARAMIYDIRNGKSHETQLFEEAKQDLDVIFDSVKDKKTATQNIETAPTPDTNTPKAEDYLVTTLETMLLNSTSTVSTTEAVLGVAISSTPEFPTPEMRTTTLE